MNLLTQAGAVLADKAYDTDKRMRQKIENKGCTAVIPFKKKPGDPGGV